MTGAAAVRAIIAVTCCLGLAACSDRPAPVAAPAGPAGPVTRTSGPTPYRTPLPATTAAVPTVGRTAACRTSRLKISVLRRPAAGGYLGFTSRARRPCTLHGWPAVTGITAAGKTSAACTRIWISPVVPAHYVYRP